MIFLMSVQSTLSELWLFITINKAAFGCSGSSDDIPLCRFWWATRLCHILLQLSYVAIGASALSDYCDCFVWVWSHMWEGPEERGAQRLPLCWPGRVLGLLAYPDFLWADSFARFSTLRSLSGLPFLILLSSSSCVTALTFRWSRRAGENRKPWL